MRLVWMFLGDKAFLFGPVFRARKTFLKAVPCCLLFLLATIVPAAWAATAGSISGTVTDPKGLVVNGATVTVTEVNTNVKQTTTTDSKGFYSLTELAVGVYEV